ncbi:hypothetical protein [Aeromonas enteropelogenes]|uniref:hypothetical protein n=1 Tax=Aeromonas enteropelogenes TaxID=29489 RepID=UPI003BA2B6FD
MNAAEKAIAEMHAAIYRTKSRVATYWGRLNQSQRNAICHEAELPISLAKPEFPLGKGDREALRLAVRRLGYQSLFQGVMAYEEWRDGLIPLLEEKTEGEEQKPANELEKKKALLKEVQTANRGQKKTPVTGAPHA